MTRSVRRTESGRSEDMHICRFNVLVVVGDAEDAGRVVDGLLEARLAELRTMRPAEHLEGEVGDVISRSLLAGAGAEVGRVRKLMLEREEEASKGGV